MARTKSQSRPRPRPYICRHHTGGSIKRERILGRIKSSASMGFACQTCNNKVKDSLDMPPKKRMEVVPEGTVHWVCWICEESFCGVENEYGPSGHAFDHGKKDKHSFSIRVDKPSELYCFVCEIYRLVTTEEEKNLEDEDNERPKMFVRKYAKGMQQQKFNYPCRFKGLPNLVNTCYFNAALQNLFAMDRLGQCLANLEMPVGYVTGALKRLFNETYDDFRVTIQPQELLDFVQKDQRFVAGIQHDSHELLLYLLDKLQSEGMSFVDEIFRGEFSSILCCDRCGKTSTTHDPLLDLSLQIPTKIHPNERNEIISPKTDVPLKVHPNERNGIISPKINVPAVEKHEGSQDGGVIEKSLTVDSDEEVNVNVCSIKPAVVFDTTIPISWNLNALNHDEVCEVDDMSGPLSIEKCLVLFTEPEDLLDNHCVHCSPPLQHQKPSEASEFQGSRVKSESEKNLGSPSKSSNQQDVGCNGHILAPSLGNEQLRKDEDMKTKCKEVKRKLIKKLLFKRLPFILTIQLKRFFQLKSGKFKKIEGHVVFHEMLDFMPYMDSRFVGEEKYVYRLIGIVEHLGSSMTFGHYVAYVRAEQNQEGKDSWFKADDTEIEEVSLKEVLKRNAYLLFYERTCY
ncbi:uncharacterized protein A4U43_C09F7890 [Asparagus officinalis]|uniref:Uncharacterized protein n=1 Tax=Asparagus officinalis TaxID=4686 RepID=A0A5P1E689_ASPOF|nr:ubiquitin carboxyl-terminal hydrolase 2-like [Asparagus officinalis]XP_020247044.1 ubiquitin carboxyl-terminal hydrolase 2-like [Asparagus officinalis]XP_020247045.1 ubiquitin carboxyl-terminal hydrolase 2-like [Asparagus officinalis]ONK58078.1 uncharacterized protein A4U43_C09F7890 [Asparagus officinalis]